MTVAQWKNEAHSVQNTNNQILQEYSTNCQKLDLAQKQLAHLAQRANEAALAYEFKDNELKRMALENERVIQEMNNKANADKLELEKRLQLSCSQCQDIVERATESQKQAHERIESILADHHREKDLMTAQMQEFAKQGAADGDKLTFYEQQYAQIQFAFNHLRDAETKGRQENTQRIIIH